MATQGPSNPAHDKVSNPATELEQPINEDSQDEREVNKQTSTGSVFVNSEPVREEQVQNAVKFLSHPKVRGSPVMYRRSFLEKKGLTKEEIDEAFRRVPDPSPSAQASNVNNEGQGKSSSNIQLQAPKQTLQPATSGPSGVVSAVGSVAHSRFQWTHAVYAIGILAISGAGSILIIKKTIVPRLKSWIRKIVLEEDDDLGKKIDAKPSLAEEAVAAAKAAAAAAADVAKASQEMLYSKNEESRKFEEFVSLLDAQVREMKVMTSALQRLEGQTNVQGRTSASYQEDPRATVTSSKQQYMNGKTEYDTRSVRSSSPPSAVESQPAPHSKSYMEIVAMVQRGEKPANIRDINDLPPNPNQQPSNPRLAPKTKPWEVGSTQNNSHPFLQSQGNGEIVTPFVPDNGVASLQMNGESSVPWWQRKNVRITEIENEDEPKSATNDGTVSEASSFRRSWVPPQPPPVAMAEAAEAIRRPKPSIHKEQMNDEQLLARANVTDELQRITKVLESGGAVDTGSGSFAVSSNEIQEVEENI